jgi:hypothetical protein
MSGQRTNIFAADVAVTTDAGRPTLDRGQTGPRWAIDEYRRVYDAPLPDDAPRLRRCTYPLCVDEAAVRCATCWRRFCARHCPEPRAGAGGTRQECVLCTRHVRLDRAAAPSRHGLVSAACAVALFLAAVGVGIAVDVSAKAQGLVAFAVFAGAFWVFLRYVDG